MKERLNPFIGKILLFFLFSAMIFLSCNESRKSPNTELPSNDSTVFYPVQEYIFDQIKNVHATASSIHLLTSTNGKKDSFSLTQGKFDTLARAFLENNIADLSVKKYYRQSVFHDQTTNSYTFNYTSVNPSLPVQNLDVLLDTATQKVKMLFIAKTKSKGDSTISEKLTWKTDKNFLIVRITQLPSNEEMIEQISVSWE